jgi:hypothetical protein
VKTYIKKRILDEGIMRNYDARHQRGECDKQRKKIQTAHCHEYYLQAFPLKQKICHKKSQIIENVVSGNRNADPRTQPPIRKLAVHLSFRGQGDVVHESVHDFQSL